jgi:hypothetical protein
MKLNAKLSTADEMARGGRVRENGYDEEPQ